MSYLNMKENRPGYSYIDPETGQERAYEKIYSPEEAGIGDPRLGPYSVWMFRRLKTGGTSRVLKNLMKVVLTIFHQKFHMMKTMLTIMLEHLVM